MAHGPPQTSLWEFVQESGLRSMVLGLSKDPNAKVTVLLISERTGRPVLAVKAPTTDRAAEAVDHEVRALRTLAARDLGAIQQSIPTVIDTVEFGGRTAVVTTAVDGKPMTTSYMDQGHTASSARVAADFASVEAWLASLQTATGADPSPLEMDGGVVEHLQRRFAEDTRLPDDLRRLEEIHWRLRSHVVPRTAVHGDFWLGNILRTGPRVSGVVDWEAAADSGEPVRDLVRFAVMYALYLDRRTRSGRRVRGHDGLRAGGFGAGLEFALEGVGWFPELFRGFLGAGLARLGASSSAWRETMLAGIAEVAAITDEPQFAARHLQLFRRLTAPRQFRKEKR